MAAQALNRQLDFRWTRVLAGVTRFSNVPNPVRCDETSCQAVEIVEVKAVFSNSLITCVPLPYE